MAQNDWHDTAHAAIQAMSPEQRRRYVGVEWAGGKCRVVLAPPRKPARSSRTASRAEQNARYIDCGPGAWDDRD